MEVGGEGAEVGSGAVQSDRWPSGRGRGDVVVAGVRWDGEAWGGSGLLVETFDRDGGALEDASVEGGRAASEEGLHLVAGAEGGPSAAGAFDGEPLGEGFGRSASSAKGDGAEGEGGVAFSDVGPAAGGGEREWLEIRRSLNGG